MLLAIDMGNTQTALGLFDGEELIHSWRMPTDRSFTADELHVRLHGYFRMYDMTLDAVDAVAFAGVVPELNRAWRRVAERLSARAVVVGPDTAAVTRVRAENPAEVGADRIANATAAVRYYGAPAIVVDFGTATNIDVVDDEGYYIGGAIAPGLRISMDALVSRAARLSGVPAGTRPRDWRQHRRSRAIGRRAGHRRHGREARRAHQARAGRRKRDGYRDWWARPRYRRVDRCV